MFGSASDVVKTDRYVGGCTEEGVPKVMHTEVAPNTGRQQRRPPHSIPEIGPALPALVVLAAPLPALRLHEVVADEHPVDAGSGEGLGNRPAPELVDEPPWSPAGMGSA